MRRVTVRVPDELVAAYDRADGNRSKLMRRALAEAVSDGEVAGVPEDLRTLAAVEEIVADGQLARRRGTFRKRVAEFFEDKWESGYVTGADAADMAESWRREATMYGPSHVAFVDAVADWYADNWDPVARPAWPTPGTFHTIADPDTVDVRDRLVDVMREAREEGLARREAVERVSQYHPDEKVEAAARRAWGEGT